MSGGIVRGEIVQGGNCPTPRMDTYRHTDMHGGKHAARYADGQTGTHTGKQIGRKTYREGGRKTDRRIDIYTIKETNSKPE